MPHRRQLALLILFLLALLSIGCGLSQAIFPTPTNTYQTITPDLTESPYTRALKATGEAMKATAFTQIRTAPTAIHFREHPDPILFMTSLEGIVMVLIGVGFLQHYAHVKRRGWAAGVSYRGFKVLTGVVTGKQARRGAKMDYWYGLFWLTLGIFLTISGILIAVIQ